MSVTGHYWRLNDDEWAQLEPYLAAETGTDFYREGRRLSLHSSRKNGSRPNVTSTSRRSGICSIAC